MIVYLALALGGASTFLLFTIGRTLIEIHAELTALRRYHHLALFHDGSPLLYGIAKNASEAAERLKRLPTDPDF